MRRGNLVYLWQGNVFWPRIERPIWWEELGVSGVFRGLLELSLGASPPETPPPRPPVPEKTVEKPGKRWSDKIFIFAHTPPAPTSGSSIVSRMNLPSKSAAFLWTLRSFTAFSILTNVSLSGLVKHARYARARRSKR